MVEEENILHTAALLNISIQDDEIQPLQESFSRLVEYFKVMQDALVQTSAEELMPEHEKVVKYREDVAIRNTMSEELIARSDEHEDDFVVIPNVF